MIAIKNVLVATDFSPPAQTALNYGRELARRFGATLHVIHVIDDMSVRILGATGAAYDTSALQRDVTEAARKRLEALLTADDHRELHAVAVDSVSVAPAREIVEYAANARIDLIVVGTQGHTGLAHMVLGSVAERVVRTAHCPVLTVHRPEREFIRIDPPGRSSSFA
jgi:nucleotide-binding universal stress UspA family protein